MLADSSRLHSGARTSMALAVRGRAIRTFGGQVFILIVGLVLLGSYLIADEFKNPVSSQSVGLFAAAFILATAMTLLIELTQIFRIAGRHLASNLGYSPRSKGGVRFAARNSSVPRNFRPFLPYHRVYVDGVRVRA